MPELHKIESSKNISEAWGKAFLTLYDENEISPLVISVTGFPNSLEVPENQEIRTALDISLSNIREKSVRTVANTIFPNSLWNPQKPREELYTRHNRIIPSIESCQANKRGHYFRRMISYQNDNKSVNQLEKVLDLWDGNHRHSGMQVALFDPLKDHIPNPIMGFPCLHQISFDYYGPNGRDGLGITAFYGTQHIYRKAYGNYLGLVRLGHFMAKEMGLDFVRLNCIAGKATFTTDFRKTTQHVLDLKNVIEQHVEL